MNYVAATFLMMTMALSALAASAARAETSAWETDLAVALGKSKELNKDLLLVFRGPSTNAVCKRVNEEILDGLEFRTVVGHEFVLFSVLAPEDAHRDDAEQSAYRAILKRFHVTAYPIILAANQGGRVYGQTAVQVPEAKALIRAVGELRPRRDILNDALKAAAQDGDARQSAKALSEALESLGEHFAITYHGDLVDKVLELDSDDSQGLKALWENRRYSVSTLAKFNQIYVSIAPTLWSKESAAEMVELLEATIRKHNLEGELRQLMEMQKFRVWGNERNYPKMIEAALEARKLAPDSNLGKKIPAMIKRVEEAAEKAKTNPVADKAPDPKSGETPVKPAENVPGKKAGENPPRTAAEKPATARETFNRIYEAISPALREKGSAAEVVKLLDATIEEHAMQGEARQLMEMQKYRAWNREQNYHKMIDVMQEAQKIAPDSNLAKRFPAIIQQIEKLAAEADAAAKASAGAEKVSDPDADR